MSLEEVKSVGKKQIVKKIEEVTVPLYKFTNIEKEIRTYKEIPIEAVPKKEILDLLESIKGELKAFAKVVSEIVRYQIREQDVVSQRVVYQDIKVLNPVLENVPVKNPVFQDVKIERPIFVEKRIEEVSQRDLENLNEYKKRIAEVLELLDKVRDVKIKEETIRIEKQVFVPKKVEVPQEKIVFTVKDEVIDDIEELLTFLKKNKTK